MVEEPRLSKVKDFWCDYTKQRNRLFDETVSIDSTIEPTLTNLFSFLWVLLFSFWFKRATATRRAVGTTSFMAKSKQGKGQAWILRTTPTIASAEVDAKYLLKLQAAAMPPVHPVHPVHESMSRYQENQQQLASEKAHGEADGPTPSIMRTFARARIPATTNEKPRSRGRQQGLTMYKCQMLVRMYIQACQASALAAGGTHAEGLQSDGGPTLALFQSRIHGRYGAS